MRTTTLTCIQWRKHADSDADVRLKKFWKHSENGRKLQNIHCKVQIEVLVVTILACMVSVLAIGKIRGRVDGSLRTKGGADKHTVAHATDYTLHRPYDGYFDPLYHILFINFEEVPTNLPHTFTDCRDAIVECQEELIVNISKNCGNMAYQL